MLPLHYIYQLKNSGGNEIKKIVLWAVLFFAFILTLSYADSPGSLGDSRVFDIAIMPNNDVYIAGYYSDGNGKWVACYWKNGARIILPAPSNSRSRFDGSRANAIAAAPDGTVYIIGSFYDDNDEQIPCYWKNGIRTDLPVPTR